MASLKKRPGSQMWVACYTLPDGARRQASTHTADAGEAMQIALSYEKASGMARSHRLTATTAKRVLAEIASIAGSNIGGEVSTVRVFLGRQLESLKKTQRGRTLEKYTHHLQLFIDEAELADETLDSITQAHAADWRDHLTERGLSGTTINQHLGTLRRSFADATQREMISRNPFAAATVKGTKKKKQRREAFTIPQFFALLDALELADCPIPHADEWLTLVMLGGYTGQRKNDCVRLTAEQVDLRAGVIRFWRSKNNNWHEVAIHPALLRRLSPLVKATGKGLLLPNLAALPATGRNSSTDTFRQQILPLIGLSQPYADAGASRGRRIAPFSFHSLRHSLSSWLNAAGATQADRMALVGHEDSRVSDGYTHTGLENARRVIALIPERGAGG